MTSDTAGWRTAGKSWRALQKQGEPGGPVIGITSSFTANNLDPQLGMALVEHGWDTPDLRQGEYNQIHQACMSPDIHFGAQPDYVVILFRIEDVFARDVWSYIGGDDAAGDAAVSGAGEIAQFAAKLAESGVGVVFALPPLPAPAGVDGLDTRISSRLTQLNARAREAISGAIADVAGLDVLDLGGLVNEAGRAAVSDSRKYLLYRQPYTEEFFHTLGNEIARLLVQRTKAFPKCIAIDCDNTLWGGVIGEDGIGGIELGTDFPGSAFQRFQEQLLLLKRSGVLLCAVSKNDEDAVFEVFEKHPGMILKPEDIASWRVNWIPKSENIKSLSEELNFGLDAFVFIDDSHFEVAEVSNALPEVTVLQVPEETSEFIDLLPASGLFRNIEPTADDAERTRRVQQEAERRSESASLNPEDFLASLGLKVVAKRADEHDLGRVTQLINKTNQFNLTTQRRDEGEVATLVASENHDVLAISVEDRFGDYGLVGVVIIDHTDESEIDTFLLSCRVLGRGVEFAVLSAALQTANGSTTVTGRYLSTLKNGQVADFYPRAGFDTASETDFTLPVATGVECPAHIELTIT